MSDSDLEKEHAPSEKRLADARKRGEIARSAEANAAAAFAGLLVALAAAGGYAAQHFGAAAQGLLASADRIAAPGADGQPNGAALTGAIAAMTGPGLPLLLAPGLAVLALLLALRGLVFAPARLAPRLSRIDPIASARHRFGLEGIADFLRNLVKAGLIGTATGYMLWQRLPWLVALQAAEPRQVAAALCGQVVGFVAMLAATWTVVGAADMLWQRFTHIRRNRMSRQDLVEEHREAEGDPHIKQQRQARAKQIAMNRMMLDVPKADVVIVNPTHYAVALRWDRASGRPPVCVAKGTDDLAARIRAAAQTAGVPVRADPPTARALHGAVAIGEVIRPEHYAAVAAAIRFAEAMRKRARVRTGG